MNKSTPLAELPNLKKGDNSNAYDEKENQIVSEILSEIDNSNKENMNMNIDNSHQENSVMIEEQKMLEEQKHMMNQEQEQMMHQESNNRRLEDSLNQSVNDNMINNIIRMIKQPLIVAVIVALVSIPKVGEMLTSFLSGKEKLAAYSVLIVLIIKSLIGASMFYGINMNV
jgi:hypothetical protein